MGTVGEPIRLNEGEKKLFDNIRNGQATQFGPNSTDKTIRAETLRHIILGLPVDQDSNGIFLKAASLIGLVRSEARCPITGAGLQVEGALIDGDLNLDSIIGEAGGPLFPLTFTACEFQGSVSARHAHIARLSLRSCRFLTASADGAAQMRVVDLTGARLDRELDMAGIRPEPEDGVLRFSAPGLRVGGGIDLAGCLLRAPTGSDTEQCSEALDLTLAQINGDLELEKARLEGCLKLRATHIRGDLWLNGATVEHAGASEAFLLQGTRIEGFLSTRATTDSEGMLFTCRGNINLAATEIGRSLILKIPKLTGNIDAPDLVVRDDVFLHGDVTGTIRLERARIGGSLDLSRLKIGGPATELKSGEPQADCEAEGSPSPATPILCLQDMRIGAAFRLEPRSTMPILAAGLPERFEAEGIIDLQGAACDTLDDEVGQSWRGKSQIWMNHFTYRRTGWLTGAQPSHDQSKSRRGGLRFLIDWVHSRLADGPWPARWPRFRRNSDFWEPWQLRRNWIYRQFESDKTRAAFADNFVSITRHRIREDEYRPQPFEQAIKVARAEGRESSAAQFEIHKKRLEWRFFNRRVRWGLAFLAISLASMWLIHLDDPSKSDALTIAMLVLTVVLMIAGSWLRPIIRKRLVLPLLSGGRGLVLLVLVLVGLGVALAILKLLFGFAAVWVIALSFAPIGAALPAIGGSWLALYIYRPLHPELGTICREVLDISSKILTWIVYGLPALALFYFDGWHERPFQFVVAFLIFVGIRLIAVIAHQLMRLCFGYLRRPINALGTLLLAFVLGWWGVHIANSRGMLVIAAEPVAGVAAPDSHAHFPSGHRVSGTPVLMGSTRVAEGPNIARELPCTAIVSEPLYALDVLIPLVDLYEESRCEVRRVPASDRHRYGSDGMSIGELGGAFPDLAFEDHRFWWWAKAIYAILGWVLVSLSLLTFAQVNKAHAEPPEEHN